MLRPSFRYGVFADEASCSCLGVQRLCRCNCLRSGLLLWSACVGIDPGYDRRAYEERRWERERRLRDERRFGAYEDGYGRGGCRTVTIRSEDPYGNKRVKRIRRCG